MKRMSHPQHGFTHAHNTNEVTYLVARGWSVEESQVWPEIAASEVTHIYVSEEDFIRSEYLKKFGKKPHHMAKLETIKKALDDDSK